MNPTPTDDTPAATPVLSWSRASEVSPGARFAVLSFAALGHYAFIASLSWERLGSPWFPLLAALPNVAVLSAVAFADRKIAWLREGAAAAVVGATLALGLGTCVVGLVSDVSLRQLPAMLLVSVLIGAVCGLMGMTVAVPLGKAIDRWRADPSPRRALDVWATLACVAVVFALLRPLGFEQRARLCAAFHHEEYCSNLGLGRLLMALDRSLAALTLVIAAAVTVLDWQLRRLIARAHVGGIAGCRVAPPGAAAAGGAVSLAVTHDQEMVALLGPPGEGSYREAPTGSVLALIPKSPTLPWRLVAMPIVAALCALSLLRG